MTADRALDILAMSEQARWREGIEQEDVNEAIETIRNNLSDNVLGKIKAEIEAKCCITTGRENDGAMTLHDIFEIIDKYRAEQENEK